MQYRRTFCVSLPSVAALLAIGFLRAAIGAEEVGAKQLQNAQLTDYGKRLKPLEAEMLDADKILKDLTKRHESLLNEFASPQRRRSPEEIRAELKTVVAETEKQIQRRRAAADAHDQAFRDSVREHDDLVTGFAAVPANKRVRADFFEWRKPGAAVARAFCEKNPGVRFRYDGGGDGGLGAFERGALDLLGLCHDYKMYYTGRAAERFSAVYPTPPKTITVGYYPLVVAVHPSNPLDGITIKRLRLLATDRNATWKSLGRANDGPCHLTIFDSFHFALFLTGKTNTGTIHDHCRDGAKSTGASLDRMFTTIAEDPNAILIWRYTPRVAESGLKILPLLDSRGEPSAPNDPSAVASGRYPLRTPLVLLVHPNAGPAARQFAEWIVSDEAAKVMQKDRDTDPAADEPLLAHVAWAAKDAPNQVLRAKTPAVADEIKAGEIDSPAISGAAAVLPTERLSRYFLMATPVHQTLYEQTIRDAIRADGRLNTVDRAELGRLLQERELAYFGSPPSEPRPMIAADVLVFSRVVVEAEKAFLKIEAVHGSTALLLGELTLPINPANPARFEPSLARSVAAWWSSVLRRLADVRSKPVWTLIDVYAASVELDESAEAVRTEIATALTADRRLFFAARTEMAKTREEALLRLMGLSRTVGGRFPNAADYLIEARLDTADRAVIRLHGRDGALLEATTIAATNRSSLLCEIKAWLAAQASRRAGKPPTAGLAKTEDAAPDNDWSQAQARLEFTAGTQWREKAGRRQKDYDRIVQEMYRQGITAFSSNEHEPLLQARRDIRRSQAAAKRHYCRAAQLDPAWEEAAYAALIPVDDWLFSSNHRETPFAEPLDDYERFLDQFPQSERARWVLAEYARGCLGLTGKHGRFPPGLDERAARLQYYRKGLASCRRYILQYSLKDDHDSDWRKFMPNYYFFHLRRYIECADLSEAEQRAILQDWSASFDARLDRVAHGDFVRLVILAKRKSRAEFLALLTEMQRRWPDPNHAQWKRLQTAEVVGELLRSLFPEYHGENSFALWLSGRRDIGDLPWPGYVPDAKSR